MLSGEVLKNHEVKLMCSPLRSGIAVFVEKGVHLEIREPAVLIYHRGPTDAAKICSTLMGPAETF